MVTSKRKQARAVTSEKRTRPKASPRTRVFKFGCLAPTGGEREIVFEQFRQGHDYRRKLTEIYNDARERARDLRPSDKRLQLLYEQRRKLVSKIVELREVIMETRMLKRSRITPPELLEKNKKLREQYSENKKQISERWKLLPKRAIAALNKERKQIDDLANESIKTDARNNADVRRDIHWGSYQLVELAAKDSYNKTPMWNKRSFPQRMRCESFRGEGVVSVQIQSGANKAPFFTSDLFTDLKENTVKLEPAEADRRGRVFTTLRMRATESGKTVTWPILLHRPLPLGVVKRVAVVCRKVGPREVWEALFWVDVSPKAATCGAGSVAVHFGWKRMRDGRIRAATWLDTHGNAGEVFVDPEQTLRDDKQTSGDYTLEEKLAKKRSLESIRMKNLNEIVAKLREFIDTHDGVPRWFENEIKSIARGIAVHDGDEDGEEKEVRVREHSIARLARVIRWWRGEPFRREAKVVERRGKKIELPEMVVGGRFAGDDVAFADAEDWRYNDHHLWQWQTSIQKACYSRRKDHYRKVAAQLAKRYDTVIVDDTMFSVGVKIDRVEDGKESPFARDAVSELRKLAAPYELRDIVKNAFVAREGRVETVSCKGISSECPHCLKKSKLTTEHIFVCAHCGYERELDTVALMNILRRGGHDRAVDEIVKRDLELKEKLRRTPMVAE